MRKYRVNSKKHISLYRHSTFNTSYPHTNFCSCYSYPSLSLCPSPSLLHNAQPTWCIWGLASPSLMIPRSTTIALLPFTPAVIGKMVSLMKGVSWFRSNLGNPQLIRLKSEFYQELNSSWL